MDKNELRKTFAMFIDDPTADVTVTVRSALSADAEELAAKVVAACQVTGHLGAARITLRAFKSALVSGLAQQRLAAVIEAEKKSLAINVEFTNRDGLIGAEAEVHAALDAARARPGTRDTPKPKRKAKR